MVKASTTKTNGNIFKTIVRSVVREEVAVIVRKEMNPFREGLQREMSSFRQEMKEEMSSFKEEVTENMEGLYKKYRDDVLTRLDETIVTLKKTDEKQTMHAGQHQDINDRIGSLESIHPHGKHA